MTGGMMSGLTVATILTILLLAGVCAARFKVERTVAPNARTPVAADAA